MTLHSPTFLFLFLPGFFFLYFICGRRLRNLLIVLASLLFFLWSDPIYSPVIVCMGLINYLLGRGIASRKEESKESRRLVVTGISINLLVLLIFKVYSTYWQEIISLSFQLFSLEIPQVLAGYLPKIVGFPLGLSFLTFQAISYLIDINKGRNTGEKSLVRFLEYYLLFPKAIAGPIVRYRDIAGQLGERELNAERVAGGLRRFMQGFLKKTLIADQLSAITDRGLFWQPPANLSTGIAWLGILCFTLQIYYDFSAYSDMAIGLGKMLGFDFVENFNYPYISTSINEFWRRWHISLSTWFRDYVFYPLERKRRSFRLLSQPVNILIVFFLTGLWHGITPTFLVWGLLHGAAIAFEQSKIGAHLQRLWRPLQHGYALLIIILGWVFFRSPSLPYAWAYLKALSGFSKPIQALPLSVFPPVSALLWVVLAFAIIFAFPVFPSLKSRLVNRLSTQHLEIFRRAYDVFLIAFFILGIIYQAGSTFQPFIYGEF